ncbi:MAG: dihydrofolate reductase family protein [bacterium]|nr:dihydrofolate reductase family protein [bacterium]
MKARNQKPKFILLAAVSLDGRITRGKKQGSDWTSKEDKEFFHQELNRADVAIMGRKTFDAIKRPLTLRNRIVFTHFASVIPAEAGTQVGFSGGKRKLLKLLKSQNWTRIAIVGGTSIYDWFLGHNLVNEMYLTVEPVIFGAGRPLLSKERMTLARFKLASSKQLNSQGTLLLHYKI